MCFSECSGVRVLPKGGSVNGFSVSVLVFLCVIQNFMDLKTYTHAYKHCNLRVFPPEFNRGPRLLYLAEKAFTIDQPKNLCNVCVPKLINKSRLKHGSKF